MKFCHSPVIIILLYCAASIRASTGDRAQPFRDCLALCEAQRCQDGADHHFPLFLRLMRWTCLDDCKYTCMHLITDIAQADERPIMQYYGKWPFWRFMGMQEPASVFFSLMNLWAHLKGWRSVNKQVMQTHPMRWFILAWSVISMNAWFWSSVFHTRERMDYFSAALAILSALHFTVARFFFTGRPERRRLYTLWTIGCALAYTSHVSYLYMLPRFDYTYNIIFNLIVGMSHNLLWAIYSLPSSFTIVRRFPSTMTPRNYRPTFASTAALCVGLTIIATLLELFDFPPIGRVLDAHALWHAATIPIAIVWYKFLINDTLDEGWRVNRL